LKIRYSGNNGKTSGHSFQALPVQNWTEDFY
jgi:hypothetical protein